MAFYSVLPLFLIAQLREVRLFQKKTRKPSCRVATRVAYSILLGVILQPLVEPPTS